MTPTWPSTTGFHRRFVTAVAIAGAALATTGIANAALDSRDDGGSTSADPTELADERSAIVALRDDNAAVASTPTDATAANASAIVSPATATLASFRPEGARPASTTVDDSGVDSDIVDAGRWRRHDRFDHDGFDDSSLAEDIVAQVTAAVEAAVPGGTVEWVRGVGDDDGEDDVAYVAHVTDADDSDLWVTLDADIEIIDTRDEGHGRDGHRGTRRGDDPRCSDDETPDDVEEPSDDEASADTAG